MGGPRRESALNATMSKTMLAAVYDRNGPAREVLRVVELPMPEPSPGEVRVRVHASGVNPADVKNRKRRPLDGLSFIVPQVDGAGVIDAVGTGVPASRVGERVWTWAPHWPRPFGTAAQYVTLPAVQAVPLPANVSFDIGACIGIPLLTAYRAVTCDGLVGGESVLVQGGAGAVGHYVVQLAKLHGARVIATVSSDAKAGQAREAGADFVIDYKREDVAARVKALTDGRGVDRIIETNLAVNSPQYVNALRRDGSVVVYGSDDWTVSLPKAAFLLHGVRLYFFIVLNLVPHVRSAAHGAVDALLRRNALQHRIGERFPLKDIVAAHEAVENGTVIGNAIVVPPGIS